MTKNATFGLARRGKAFLVALLFALALTSGPSASPALAGTDAFCSGSVDAGAVCPGPSHSLTASRGTNNTSGAGCGGAYGYGTYYCAIPAGCHTYSGANVLTPAIRHRSSTAKNMSGYSTWGSTGPPTNCDPGSPYRVTGPVADAAVQLPGVPVLTRPVETAPKAVAALVPGARADGARRFSTPSGNGWVLVDPTTRRVCVAVDDNGTGYGFSCQGYNAARLIGSLSTLEDEDATSAEGDIAIALVPQGSAGLEISRRGGGSVTLAPVDGVVVTRLGDTDTAISLDAADDASVPAQTLAVGRR